MRYAVILALFLLLSAMAGAEKDLDWSYFFHEPVPWTIPYPNKLVYLIGAFHE